MKLFIKILIFILIFSENCEFSSSFELRNTRFFHELNYLNTSVDPCDNFYEFSCGNFKNVHPLPEGQYNWDHYTILQDEIHQLSKVILQSQRKSSDPLALQKAKAAYTACLDVEYADLLDLPLVKVMKKHEIWPVISNITEDIDVTWNDVASLVSEYGVPLFFNFQVLPNYFNATDNFIYLYRDSLSNPATINGKLEKDLEEYLHLSMKNSRLATKDEPIPFEAFLRTVAFHLRDVLDTNKSNDDIIEDVAEIINFMRVLQPGGVIESGTTIISLPTLTSIGELQAWTDEQFGADFQINWLDYFDNLFKTSNISATKDMKIYQAGVDLIYGVLNLFRQTEPRLLKNFIMARLFTYMAPDSDEVLRNAFDLFYTNQNYDVYPRWQYCLRKILGYPDNIEYSLAVTYEYQKYHFNVNKFEKAAELLENIENAFEEILNEANWMDQDTKTSAIKKANNIIALLGYPDHLEDPEFLDEYYDNLRVCTWEHFWNSQRGRAFSQSLNFGLITKPRNRELWNSSPLEVNAFYNRANNRILLPISMLNSIFFDGNLDALDYGRIGAIIGHEITHGFDLNGKNYNELGLMENWWSTNTEIAFQERINCFVEQYSKYLIEEIGTYVDGSKTLNENLADNGGLQTAFKAFQKIKNDQISTAITREIEGFSEEQLFFIGFATMWCRVETDYYLEQMHKSNVYSPARYRVIGSVSNMDEFSNAFNCPTGSDMNPESKCVLW